MANSEAGGVVGLLDRELREEQGRGRELDPGERQAGAGVKAVNHVATCR